MTAHGPDDDFNFLEIGRAAFDLSDRGVSGRPQPGPVDAFLYTDRGIYRPGETVELVALVRDDKADAIVGPAGRLAAVAAGRDRGREAAADRRPAGRLSSRALPCRATPASALGGSSCGSTRKRRRSARAEFRVEDFVPPQLKVALAAADGPIRPGEAFPVDVDARYYYGAPGAGLAIEAEAVDRARRRPLPEAAGLPFRPRRRGIHRRSPRHRGAVDRRERQSALAGRAERSARPDPPLAATIRVGVFEPSGRAVSETVTRPIRQRPWRSGCARRPATTRCRRAAEAKLEVIAVDPQGAPIAAKGLRFELLRETWEYRWYSVNGVWRHKSHIRSQPIDAGTLDVAADAPATWRGNCPPGAIAGRSPTPRAARNRACGFMSAGGSRPSCPMCRTSSRRRSTSRAISRARPPSCSSRRRLPARPSWRSPRTGSCRCAR